ncbi:MAG: electron transfer flavoprotein subunit alpha [Bacteroidetes bacterium 4572_117]|nr:MAG: electron transfer flavoprotein subunit alpha [Bacteroidetes bacterium 4572_117]
MKVLLCISHVPDTTSKIRFTDNDTAFDKTDIQYIIGPHEELALTRLLEVKEAIGGMTITVVNVGLKETEPTIRKALAVGADDAIRVEADPTDALFVAKQIAEVYKQGNYDLVVTGKETIDYNGAQVGEMIAELLDLPSVTSTSHFDIKDGKAQLEREIDGGKEVIEVDFPFVATSGKGFALEPRIPNMRGIMQARRKPLAVVQAVNQEIKTKTNQFYLPEVKGACTFVDAENVEELVRLLHEEAKVL